MAVKQHIVTVKKVGKQFVLFSDGCKAGMRLFKGDSKTTIWPFPYKGYVSEFPTKKLADEAAEKLQKYLDIREEELGGSKKKP